MSFERGSYRRRAARAPGPGRAHRSARTHQHSSARHPSWMAGWRTLDRVAGQATRKRPTPRQAESQAGFLFHQRDPGQMSALPLPNSAFPPAEQVAPRIGARAVCEALVREGVTTIFGYPGGTVLPIYDVLREFPLRHILVRHEQGGAHAADGYSRATGGVGVAIATSGPGAINLVTGLATAMMDSVPMVAITGNVPRALLGKDAFQETDIVGIALPVTKYATVVMDPDEVPYAVAEAFEIARSGRPGPGAARLPEGRAAARDIGPLSGALPAAAAGPAAAGARRRAGGGRPGRDDRGRRAAADPERPRRADRRTPSTCSSRSRSAPRSPLRTRCSASATWTRPIGCRPATPACTAGCTSTR